MEKSNEAAYKKHQIEIENLHDELIDTTEQIYRARDKMKTIKSETRKPLYIIQKELFSNHLIILIFGRRSCRDVVTPRKVGCVLPMVVVSILPQAVFSPNDRREDVPHLLWLGFPMCVFHRMKPHR